MIINNDIIKKYNIYDKIRNYKNIIFLERKCFSSSRPTILSSIIFQEKEINKDNDDLYELFDRLNNKNIYILSGDYHIISTMDIYKSKNKICSVKNVGAINTCINIFGVDLFIDSKKYVAKNEEINYRNGFIYVIYKNDNINLKNIMNTKTNFIYNTVNNIITAINFVFNK
jgi:phosphodiesterase/alkaline phosphatase D-like protein